MKIYKYQIPLSDRPAPFAKRPETWVVRVGLEAR
jgi:hypothetical protein